MDHVYSVFRKEPVQHAKCYLENSNATVKSSISKNNVVAFTSNIDLLHYSDQHLGIFVYVADLNLPFSPYKVTHLEDNVTLLEWDDKSNKLLIGDDAGNIQTWAMIDFLISEWQMLCSHCFSGDVILGGIWFYNGIKLLINYDKKDSNVPYQEKFHFTKIQSSVVQFGNTHTDGFLCLTSSGFVHADLFCSDGKTLSGYEFLNNHRSKYQKVDIAYMKDGHFLAIVSTGDSTLPLTCYTINVAINFKEKKKLKLSCQPYTSFTLNCNLKSPQTYPNITHLKFVVKELPDAVIVSASGKSGSIIELWELFEKPVTFHSAIHNLMEQQNQKIEITPTVLTWKFVSSSTSPSYVLAIATPRSNLFENKSTLSYIIVSFDNETINCFYRENLQMLVSVNLSTALTENPPINGNSNKTALNGYSTLASEIRKASGHSVIRDLQITWSSSAMIAIDVYSHMHLFRLSPIIDPCAPMSINYALMMLEYSLLTGNDYWDIMIGIKPSFVETLCDRITDSFIGKQTPSIQQKWYDSVLQMKATLHRCVNPGPSTKNICKAGDYYASKMLYAISETVKRLIRAREYSENEGPAEKLAFFIQNKPTDIQMLNLDKILVMLDSKDFTVETNTQLAFKYLFQWVTDLCLYLLTSIPQLYQQNQNRFPGVGLIFDHKAINTLRELLVILRFWGIMNSTILPNILKIQDNIDVIAHIFKLLTKIIVSPNDKFDDNFIDECCSLPNQILIPQMELCPKSIGVASPLLYTNSLPLIFVYGIVPRFAKYSQKLHVIDGASNCYGNRKMDAVRYVALGEVEESHSNIRSCTRCSSVSFRKSPLRFLVARAWENQWSRKCFCGGLWRVIVRKSMNYY